MYKNNKLNQFNLNYLYKNRDRKDSRVPSRLVFASLPYDELIPHLVLVFSSLVPSRNDGGREAGCNQPQQTSYSRLSGS